MFQFALVFNRFAPISPKHRRFSNYSLKSTMPRNSGPAARIGEALSALTSSPKSNLLGIEYRPHYDSVLQCDRLIFYNLCSN